MNVGFGGIAKHMHDTIIQNDDGYLGPFPRQLKVGDVHYLAFSEADEGPFWMTQAEQEKKKFDKHMGMTQPRKKKEMS